MGRTAFCAVLLLLAAVTFGEEAPKKSPEGEGREAAREAGAVARAVDEFPLNERFKKHWPTAEDLKWFHGAKGMTTAGVLKTYGKPTKITRDDDGAETWHYPWAAVALMYLKEGRVHGVWYDAGY